MTNEKIMSTICDSICRHPYRVESQAELDILCEDCVVNKLEASDDDLISRADAIDAIDAVVCHIWHTPNEVYRQFNCENIVREVVEDAIKRIPSAETLQNLTKPSKTYEDDLISRQDAIEAVFAVSRRVPTMAIRAKNALESLPSAEGGDAETNPIPTGTGVMIQSPNGADIPSAEAVQGEWVRDKETEKDNELIYHKVWTCPFCGEQQLRPKPSNFCHNCGARLYKGGDDE